MGLKIFTEAGYTKGFGHFSRMSGVCSALRKNGKDCVLFLEADDVAQKLLKRDFVQFCSWRSCEFMQQHISHEDIVIVDSYYVDISFLKETKFLCRKLIIIDDNMRLDYENMTIINPNYFGEYLQYPQDKGNQYFIGKDYTLLREPFQFNEIRSVNQEVKQILVTLGGTDLLQLTDKVVEQIKFYDKNVKLNVVVTEAYQNIEAIKSKMGQKDNLIVDADAEQMSYLMRTSDFAVSSAGGTSNELIKMQCPAILLVVADNQELNVKYLREHGLIESMPADNFHNLESMFSFDKRKKMVKLLAKKSSQRRAIDLIMEIAG